MGESVSMRLQLVKAGGRLRAQHDLLFHFLLSSPSKNSTRQQLCRVASNMADGPPEGGLHKAAALL